MRTLRVVAMILGGLLISGAVQAATVVSDQAAALVVYPGILVGDDVDTIIQMSNTSNEQVAVKCYYVNALGTCSTTGDDCLNTSNCPSSRDVCMPLWVETDFVLYLTPQQPIAWLASKGLFREDLPLDGVLIKGPHGESNAGTQIPPFGRFSSNLEGRTGIGELKCYAVNSDGTPSPRNVLKGEVTVVAGDVLSEEEDATAPSTSKDFTDFLFRDTVSGFDVVKHNAVGLRALESLDSDNHLILGGDGAEYDGCPNTLILDHFFDGADDPVTGNEVNSFLVLVPCTENFVSQVSTSLTAQYLVYNEFEQRFSTSAPVDCFFFSQLSLIDTTNSSRSIFSSNVSGTLTGQTRIRPVGSGLIGVAFEHHSTGGTASFNLDYQGERDGASDVLTVVAP